MLTLRGIDMAKCDNDDCTTFMPKNESVWFKVQEEGRTGTSDTWGTVSPTWPHNNNVLLFFLKIPMLTEPLFPPPRRLPS